MYTKKLSDTAIIVADPCPGAMSMTMAAYAKAAT